MLAIIIKIKHKIKTIIIIDLIKSNKIKMLKVENLIIS
jgi:hypothetical protein